MFRFYGDYFVEIVVIDLSKKILVSIGFDLGFFGYFMLFSDCGLWWLIWKLVNVFVMILMLYKWFINGGFSYWVKKLEGEGDGFLYFCV